MVVEPDPNASTLNWEGVLRFNLQNDFKPIVTTLMSKFEGATAFFLKLSLLPCRVIANTSFQDFQECQGITRDAFNVTAGGATPGLLLIYIPLTLSVDVEPNGQEIEIDFYVREKMRTFFFCATL